jgi:hypothetical protein
MTTLRYQDPLAIIGQHEPLPPGSYTSLVGGGQIPIDAHYDQYGFPIWSGWTPPSGRISHAAGKYQFEPATWALYAARLGISDFSPHSQDAVAAACWQHEGFAPWAPYNTKLSAAIAAAGGSGVFSLGASVLAMQPAQTGEAVVSLSVKATDQAGNPVRVVLAAVAAAMIMMMPIDGKTEPPVDFWQVNPPTFYLVPGPLGPLAHARH